MMSAKTACVFDMAIPGGTFGSAAAGVAGVSPPFLPFFLKGDCAGAVTVRAKNAATKSNITRRALVAPFTEFLKQKCISHPLRLVKSVTPSPGPLFESGRPHDRVSPRSRCRPHFGRSFPLLCILAAENLRHN